MKKIIFGITSLSFGGAERVLVDIVNELSSEYDITIFTLYGKGEFEKELSSNVKLVNMINKPYDELTKIQKLSISLKLLFNKKAIYNKYINKGFSTEIAFLEGPITRLFSAKNNNVNKVAWVHNDIGQVFGKGLKAKIKRKMDKSCYLKYNSIVFVSNDNKEQFEDIYNIDNNKVVINNYISESRILEKSQEQFYNVYDRNQINFLTVARLVKQKAFDRLIKVHAKLISEGYKHKFYVIGDGPEKENLVDMVDKLDVKNSFIFLGKKDNPYPYIKNCDVFALMSYYEGLPMTLLEAKLLEKPILITNTASREAVWDYGRSFIVNNDEQGVYEGIKQSVENLDRWASGEIKRNKNNENILKEIEKLVK